MGEIHLSDHFTYPKLMRFVLPTILMMFITMAYGIIDGFFVSNFAGKTAFAAINMIIPVQLLLGAIGYMFGTGGSALISYTMGSGDHEEAMRQFSMLIRVLVILSVILSAICFIFIPQIALLLGTTENMMHDAVLYGRIIICLNPVYVLGGAFQSLLVTAERPKIGMVLSTCAGIGNIMGDFLLVYVFRMGIVGAAAATGISWMINGIVPLIYFMTNNNSLLHFVPAKVNWKVLCRACGNGASEMVTNVALPIIAMLYNIQLIRLAGENGVAAFSVLMYISFIFTSVFMGYALGSGPIVGYHFGAGNTDEIRNILRKSILLNISFGLLMHLLAELTAGPFSYLYVGYDAELLAMTIHAMKVYSISFLICGLNMFASSFFTGLNNGAVSAAISFSRAAVFQGGAVMILPVFFGIEGVWYAVVASEIGALLTTCICFLLNRKKYNY